MKDNIHYNLLFSLTHNCPQIVLLLQIILCSVSTPGMKLLGKAEQKWFSQFGTRQLGGRIFFFSFKTKCVSGHGQPPNSCPLITSALPRGWSVFPREEVSVSGEEIQNFKTEIIGNESMDLCFLFYNLAMVGRGEALCYIIRRMQAVLFPWD